MPKEKMKEKPEASLPTEMRYLTESEKKAWREEIKRDDKIMDEYLTKKYGNKQQPTK